MKTKLSFLILVCLIYSSGGFSQGSGDVMSEKYRDIWNQEVQNNINAEIEKNRKANAVLTFENLPREAEIEVEQISHHFLFGGNIFLFGDCGSPEKNGRYEETFGELFNAATVPYWKTLEPVKANQGMRLAARTSIDAHRRTPSSTLRIEGST